MIWLRFKKKSFSWEWILGRARATETSLENLEAVIVIQVGNGGGLALGHSDAGSEVGHILDIYLKVKVNKINTEKSHGTTGLWMIIIHFIRAILSLVVPVGHSNGTWESFRKQFKRQERILGKRWKMKYLRVIHIKVRVEIVLVDDITVVERKRN